MPGNVPRRRVSAPLRREGARVIVNDVVERGVVVEGAIVTIRPAGVDVGEDCVSGIHPATNIAMSGAARALGQGGDAVRTVFVNQKAGTGARKWGGALGCRWEIPIFSPPKKVAIVN